MKKFSLALILMLIAVPVVGWAEEITMTSVTVFGKCCTKPDEKDCGECVPIKSKRQEYLDKCDEYLKQFDNPEATPEWIKINAQIATAYCLRASLEDK